jgi:hypothetical protein
MIKIALKHWIYDYCIKLLFEKISLNFNTFNIKQKFKVGEKYRIIEELGGTGYGRIYYNCVVTNGDYEWFGSVFIDIKHERRELYKPNNIIFLTQEQNLTSTVLVKHIIRIER